jgi:hypothetical protein
LLEQSNSNSHNNFVFFFKLVPRNLEEFPGPRQFFRGTNQFCREKIEREEERRKRKKGKREEK